MKKNLFLATLLIFIMSACIFTACASTKCGDTHTWRDGEITKPATCDTVGEMIQKCSVCNKTRALPVEATGHKYGKWTANADGLTHSRVCENNNEHVQIADHSDLDANGVCDACSYELTVLPVECIHEWGQWTDNEDGTCTRVCSLNNDHTETVDHIDEDENELCDNCGKDVHTHTWLEFQWDNGDTCTRVCESDPSHRETLNHVWVVIESSECSRLYECSNCATTIERIEEDNVGHSYVYVDNGDGTHTMSCSRGCTWCYAETDSHADDNSDALCDKCNADLHICEWLDWESNGDGTHSRVCETNEDHVETENCSGGVADCYNGAYCDYCYEEYTDSLGHLWGEWESNEDGTHGRICSRDPEDEHYDEEDCVYTEVSRTPATCEEAEIITYQCDVCNHTYTEEGEPATGHAYGEWVSDNQGKSTKTCANDESHTITETFISSATLRISQGIIMSMHVPESVIEDLDNVRIEFVKPYTLDGNPMSEITVVDTYTYATGKDDVTVLKFDYDNIAASEMGFQIEAHLYCGDEYLTTKVYSVKEYATRMMGVGIGREFDTLLVDMLNYGAAAQIYFDIDTDNLVNADLTEEQKSWATQTTPEINATSETVTNPDGLVVLRGTSVSAQSVIQLSFNFQLGDIDIENVEIVFDYVNGKGVAQQSVIDGSEARYFSALEHYSVAFDKYGASQLRDQMTISFRDKRTGEKIGDTRTTSIEANLTGLMSDGTTEDNLKALIVAMMKYGDSARTYFGG